MRYHHSYMTSALTDGEYWDTTAMDAAEQVDSAIETCLDIITGRAERPVELVSVATLPVPVGDRVFVLVTVIADTISDQRTPKQSLATEVI